MYTLSRNHLCQFISFKEAQEVNYFGKIKNQIQKGKQTGIQTVVSL